MLQPWNPVFRARPRRLWMLPFVAALVVAVVGAARADDAPKPASPKAEEVKPGEPKPGDAKQDPQKSDESKSGEEKPEGLTAGAIYAIVNEQLLLFATILGAIATLPSLLDFFMERRKRRERIVLSLEDAPLSSLDTQVAGFDSLLADISDLIDRAKNPLDYSDVGLGNEILLVGGPQTGKKTLARRIAKEAGLDRVVTVFNPRNESALSAARGLITKYSRQKIMLLIPRIDQVFEDEDEDLRAELDALIARTSNRENVLVVGTAVSFDPASPLNNMFRIGLVLPGTHQEAAHAVKHHAETLTTIAEVARFYLRDVRQKGFSLAADLSEADFVAMLVAQVQNSGNIAAIVSVCRTSAIFAKRRGTAPAKVITRAILQKAIHRVVVGVVTNRKVQRAEVEN